ncbi:MAG: Crp/Fnr family transcriptional regulator [Streptosporangiaceae bacterium]|jgi:CRP/FNR family cyclic AMP-dependent transcriptional regulator
MHGASFWRLLGDKEREAITAAAASREFGDGVVLCMEGEPSTQVFILLSGLTKIISVTSDGKEILQALFGEGDVVGEIAGQVTGYRTATVRAAGLVRALIIEAERFGELLDTYSAAGRAYRQAMAEQQRAAHELQRDQMLFSGSQRLAGLLLDLAEQGGDSSDDALMTILPLSQEELASLIGASRSTVARALSNWRSRRIVRTHQRNITIIDPTGLQRIAGRSQRR